MRNKGTIGLDQLRSHRRKLEESLRQRRAYHDGSHKRAELYDLDKQVEKSLSRYVNMVIKWHKQMDAMPRRREVFAIGGEEQAINGADNKQ